MKALVAYYSKTGKTRVVAHKLAQKLGADVSELVDSKSRDGIWGFFTGARDSLKKTLTEIMPLDFKPDDYDLVVVGTPVWAGNMTPAARAFFERYSLRGKKVALFCTTAVSDIDKTLAEMKVCSKDASLVGSLGLTAKDLKDESGLDSKICQFVDSIKSKL